MGDDGATVGNEVFDVHGSLGFLGLETQDLKVGVVVVVGWADRWTPVAIEMSTIQGQPVVRIRSVTTVEGCMDRFHRLSHLIGGSLFLGSLGDRHCCAVQQALVAVGVDLQPAGWGDIHRTASHATLRFFGWSDFFQPGDKQPPDFTFVRHPLAQRGRYGPGVFALNDLLSLIGIRSLNRSESSINACWRAIKDGVTAHRLDACDLQPIATIERSRHGALGGVCPHGWGSEVFLKC